jgi:quercetin dioxygenase-like cupin family protein
VQPSLHIPEGCVVRMIDFTPGAASGMHRALTLGIATVCEGEIELSLGSGESRILRPGDVSINRGAMHKWSNASKTKPARILFVMLDVKPIIVNGKALEFDVGDLMKEYADYAEDEGPNKKD